ncbi:MAG: DUF2029 domain-containing protein [Anaerolineae bacterium]|nr:DUF2029 domain-containing protein [Anaerolineae bacterium]
MSWLRSKTLDFYLVVSIIILAPLSILSIYRSFIVSRDFLYDFEVFHVATRLLHDGENPYRAWGENPDLLAEYKQPAGPLNDVYIENLPLYNLPLFPVVLYPLSGLTHDNAETVWFVLQIVMAAAIPVIVMHTFDDRPNPLLIAALALLLLAWLPTRFTLKVNQAALFAIVFAVLALYFDRKDRPVWAGVCLGLALTKYTLTGPLIVYFIVFRRFKTVIWAFLTNLAGLLVFSLMAHKSMFAVVASYVNMVSAATFGNSFPGAASLDGWLQLLGVESRTAAMVGLLLGIAAGVGLILPRFWRDLFNRGRSDPPGVGLLRQDILFLLLSAMGLFFLYHRGYDFPILILFVAFASSRWLSEVLANSDSRLLHVLQGTGLFVALFLLVPQSIIEGVLVPPVSALAADSTQLYVIQSTVTAIPEAVSSLVAFGVLLWALYRIDR